MKRKHIPNELLDMQDEDVKAALEGKGDVRLTSETTRKHEDQAPLFEYAWHVYLEHGDDAPPRDSYTWERDYRFHPERGWKLDWACVEYQVYVEVDGGQWSGGGGGRHGGDEDRVKCNTAASLGWVGFHFSPKQLTDDPMGCAALVTAGCRYQDATLRLP